jgi:flagellar biosynthesis protein
MSDTPDSNDLSKNRANSGAPRLTAAALQNDPTTSELPRLLAAGRGKWAEQIMQIAFERGIKVRQDAPLAEMLAAIELDSPIPPEAIMAVAEILAYVYANETGRTPDKADPFRNE